MGAPMGNQNARKGNIKGVGKFLKKRRKLYGFVTKSNVGKYGRTYYHSEFETGKGRKGRRINGTNYAKKWESENLAVAVRKFKNKKHGYS